MISKSNSLFFLQCTHIHLSVEKVRYKEVLQKT